MNEELALLKQMPLFAPAPPSNAPTWEDQNEGEDQ